MVTEIRNKKAGFEYHLLERYTAGMQLLGTEIKSIRNGKASIQEAYCAFDHEELWVKNMNISEYEMASHFNHDPLRNRKLLLKKKELARLLGAVKEKGLTIIPVKLFISGRGFAKLEIALAKGKKLYDKRQDIREKDVKRDLQRRGFR